MPNVNSFPVVVQDWQELLAAAKENEATLPDLAAERAALEQALAKALGLKESQSSHRASKQETTQELKKTLAEGRQVAEKVRDAAKSKIGRRSERLVQFRVAPQRKSKPRKPKVVTTPPPVVPVAPKTNPA